MGYNPLLLQDRVSIASANEYFLQPQDVLDTQDSPSTQKKLHPVVSSSQVKVSVFHDYSSDHVYTNPSTKEEETSSDQLSVTKEDLGTQL